jgi:hypothetical protein
MKKQDINEFTGSDEQSMVPDPVSKNSSRSADRSDGETAIPTFATKAEALNAVIQAVSGMPKEKIGDLFKGLTDGLNPSKNKRPADQTGDAESMANSYRSPTSVKISASEDIEDIFAGDELSEEIREKATVVFEAAVNARLIAEVARLEEENEEILSEAIEDIRTEVVEAVDKYLSYAVEQWIASNELAIETSLKTEVAEEFIGGLKGLFEAHYIDIPEDKVDVIDELTQRIESLEAQLNETIEDNINLSSAVTDATVANVFAEMSEDLAMTQAEKLRVLSEGIEYNSVDEFQRKLSIIKETYFPTERRSSSSVSLTEDVDFDYDGETQVKSTGAMSRYVDSLSKLSKK